MNLGTADVIRADSRNLPLADNSVDLVVTSPPYFALRSYQDGGEHYAGQIGAEPTPDEFVTSLLEVTAECVRVLKPSGSLWVNLGDKYAGADVQPAQSASTTLSGGRHAGVSNLGPRRRVDTSAIRAKSLIGIPWRYALRCIDDLGLILRAEVIWSKPNGLPESVTDRVRRSHEQWFHFTLQPRYFSAVDEIREAYSPNQPWGVRTLGRVDPSRGDHGQADKVVNEKNPLGKLPGSVWTVPTEPLRVPDHLGVDHFAAFPTEWPKRIIQGWSPDVVWHKEQWECSACDNYYADECTGTLDEPREDLRGCHWPELIEPARTEPAVVLDPFGGTGTTAMVAKALGRHGISVDMSADYCRLAEWRTNDRDQLAKVLGVAKAEQQPDDQLSIFDMEGGAA